MIGGFAETAHIPRKIMMTRYAADTLVMVLLLARSVFVKR